MNNVIDGYLGVCIDGALHMAKPGTWDQTFCGLRLYGTDEIAVVKKTDPKACLCCVEKVYDPDPWDNFIGVLF